MVTDDSSVISYSGHYVCSCPPPPPLPQCPLSCAPPPPLKPAPQVRLWQALTILTNFVQPPHIAPAVTSILAHLHLNNPVTIKQYQEAVVAALLVKQVCVCACACVCVLCGWKGRGGGQCVRVCVCGGGA